MAGRSFGRGRHGWTRRRAALLSVAPLVCAAPAFAQATDDNAVASAEDAFGNSVGRETIGLYDEGNVRGFSPGSAGNFRMEGMYFDIQGGLGNRTIDNEVIHVGPSAQGYAFPSPTGIVDLSLRRAGDKALFSPVLSTDSFGSLGAELDMQVPIIGNTLSVAGGVGIERPRYANGGGAASRLTLGVVPRWRPAKNVEVLAFYNRQHFADQTSGSIYIPTGAFLPPRIIRDRDINPDFTRNDSTSEAFGMVARANLGEWTLRSGLFRSRYESDTGYANLVFVRPGGDTDRQVYAFPASGSASWSGELRLSRRFREGNRQHLFTVALRGRSVESRYGGGDLVDLGLAPLNEKLNVPAPSFSFSGLTDDRTRQLTGGLSYSLAWKGIGEMTVALQRTHYEKEVAVPGLPLAKGTSNVWLPSASATITLSKAVSLYGSYMRGLEDSGTAPGFAANANMVLPAIRTRQVDLGLRWKLGSKATLILGYFKISKPYIDVDTRNIYGVLGDETHEGLEMSLAANLNKNLRIVTGAVWQRPRVTASALIAQPVGPKSVGQPELRTRFNINYTLPFFPALTLDAYVNHDSSAIGTIDNSVIAAGSTRIGGGFRYKFKIAGKPVTARFELYNIANAYELVPIGSGAYGYNTRRNATFYLAADF